MLFPLIESYLREDLLLIWQRCASFCSKDSSSGTSLEFEPTTDKSSRSVMKFEVENEERYPLAPQGLGLTEKFTNQIQILV